MIKEFSMLSLRNAELLQFANLGAGLVDSNNPTTLNVVPQLNAFKAQIAAAEALFILPRESEYSPEVQALDTLRDNNLKGMNQVINGYLKHYDAAYRAAASLLTKNIKLYGTQISRLNYQAETSVITSMTTDWEQKPELANALIVLNLTGWKDELKANNTAFNTIYTQRTQEYGGRSQDKLKDKREEVAQAYDVLIKNINARNTLDVTGMYTKVTNEFNALKDQFTTILRNRKARRGSETPDDTVTGEDKI